jgi:membrane-associated protease RseP (regulator of RpoE activity)
MAPPRRVTAGVLLAAAGLAWADPPCEEGRAQTGLALAVQSAGLAVAGVEEGSAAAESGLGVGDTVLQVNGTVLRSCADYARVVREARRERKALLLLVRRPSGEIPLVVAAATWARPVAVVETSAPAEPPSVVAVVAAAAPPPLPPDAQVTLEEVTTGLEALAPAEQPPKRLAAYREALLQVRRQTETLAAREAIPSGLVSGLRTVLGYYDAARVAWEAEEALRESERRPRHVPFDQAAAAPYFTDSPAAAAVDEFPFLRATVVRDPGPGFLGVAESAGLWRPREARQLLWARGREELARLTTWLGPGR